MSLFVMNLQEDVDTAATLKASIVELCVQRENRCWKGFMSVLQYMAQTLLQKEETLKLCKFGELNTEFSKFLLKHIANSSVLPDMFNSFPEDKLYTAISGWISDICAENGVTFEPHIN